SGPPLRCPTPPEVRTAGLLARLLFHLRASDGERTITASMFSQARGSRWPAGLFCRALDESRLSFEQIDEIRSRLLLKLHRKRIRRDPNDIIEPTLEVCPPPRPASDCGLF